MKRWESIELQGKLSSEGYGIEIRIYDLVLLDPTIYMLLSAMFFSVQSDPNCNGYLAVPVSLVTSTIYKGFLCRTYEFFHGPFIDAVLQEQN